MTPSPPGTRRGRGPEPWSTPAFVGSVLAAALSAGCAASWGAHGLPRAGPLEVTVLPGPRRATDAGIRRWLDRAAAAVAGLYGEFPVRRVAVTVEPVADAGDDPVASGSASGPPEPAVRLHLQEDADDAALDRDWVAVHEFIHLGMPPIRNVDDWLAEGWTTYYTEVLRARAGLQTEGDAWTEFLTGFERTRRSGTSRRIPEARSTVPRTHGHQRYWVGAAIALLLDVELRRGGEGRTLDDAMRALRSLGRDPGGILPAEEMMRRLDAWLGRPLFTRITMRTVGTAEVPEVDPVLRELGLAQEDGRLRLDDAAPLAAIRRSILSPHGAR